MKLPKFFYLFLVIVTSAHAQSAYRAVLLKCHGMEGNQCFQGQDPRGESITNYANDFVNNAGEGVYQPGSITRRSLRGQDGQIVAHPTPGRRLYSRCSSLYMCMFFGFRSRQLLKEHGISDFEEQDNFDQQESVGGRQLGRATGSTYSRNPNKACRTSTGEHGVFGTHYTTPSMASADACKNACTADHDCLAYEYANSESSCKLWQELPGHLHQQNGSECNLKFSTTENLPLENMLGPYPLSSTEKACLPSITCDVTWYHFQEGLLPVEAPTCDTHFVQADGNSMNFDQAVAFAPDHCHLAPVRDAEDFARLQEASIRGECWTGIQTNINAGQTADIGHWFNPIDDTPVPEDASMWKSGEPNNSHGAQTVATVNRDGSGKLRDVGKTDTFTCAIYECCSNQVAAGSEYVVVKQSMTFPQAVANAPDSCFLAPLRSVQELGFLKFSKHLEGVESWNTWIGLKSDIALTNEFNGSSAPHDLLESNYKVYINGSGELAITNESTTLASALYWCPTEEDTTTSATTNCNLIDNSDFENDAASWAIEQLTGNGITITGDAYSGAKAADIRGVCITQSFAAKSNTAYELSFFYKNSAGSGAWTGYGVDFLDGNHVEFNEQYDALGTSSSYTAKSLSFTTPPATEAMQLWFCRVGDNENLLLDSIELKEASCTSA